MKLDFSPPKEAPEEFRALTFSAPPMVKGQGRPALLASQIYHQGMPSLPADLMSKILVFSMDSAHLDYSKMSMIPSMSRAVH